MHNKYIDQMSNADLRDVAKAAMSILDAMQTRSPGVQLAGLMLAAQAVSEALEVDPSGAFQTVYNMRQEAKHKHVPEILAVAEYAKGELR